MPKAVFGVNFEKVVIQASLKHLNRIVKKKKLRRGLGDQAMIIEGANWFLNQFRAELKDSRIIQNLNRSGSVGPKEGISSASFAKGLPLMGMLGLPSSAQNIDGAIDNIRIGNSSIFFRVKKVQGKFWTGSLGFSLGSFSLDPMVKFRHGSKSVAWPMLVEYGMRSSGYVYGWWIDSQRSRSGEGIMVKSKNSNFEFTPTHVFREAFEKSLASLPEKYKMFLNIMFMR